MTRRAFGTLRQLPSKRWQASYVGPDGRRHLAHSTFRNKGDAEAWLNSEEVLIDRATWTPPEPDWDDAAPCALAPFQTKTAYACFELESRDERHDPSVTVTVHDALDRKYEKTFYLRQRLCDAPAVPVSSDASTQSE